MPIYDCRVVSHTGGTIIRQIEATSEADAKSSLNNGGEIVLHVKEARLAADETAGNVRGKKKASPDEIASTVRQISILIQSGVPLVEGLYSLAEQTRSVDLCNCLNQIAADVSRGESLSTAFAKHRGIFPKLAPELVKVAEAGGHLGDAMTRLAEHMEESAEISRRIRSALAYPIVVICVSFITVMVLVTFVLPRFVKLFSALGATVPLPTKILMSLSHALATDWYFFVVGVAAIVYLTRKYIKSAAGKRQIDYFALRTPIIGDILTKIVLGRVVASMSTLLSSGVPMIKTLEISASAADNTTVECALLDAKDQVAEGKATSQALKSTGVFPPVVIQMVASGEKTGELPTMLSHVSKLYKQETDAKVKSLTSVIEPVLIVMLGVVVGSIAVSIILPIYSLVGSVH